MENSNASEMIKAINRRISKQLDLDKSKNLKRKNTFNIKSKYFKKETNQKDISKKLYPIQSYIHPLKRKNHTNFEEMLKNFENIEYNKPKELEDIILCLEDVHNFYQEKLKKLDKDLEDINKLYVYRFKKVKEKIEIFKLFEIITDIMFYFIEYIKIKEPDNYQKEMYSKKISKANEIIKLKKNEEANIFKREPKLDNIRFFEDIHTEKELNEKSTNNTIIKTMEDNFEIKKDCHIIKNDLLDFIPKIELDFSENIEMDENLFNLLKSELKEILNEDNFSIIEMNKGSFHILISLEFLLKKIYSKEGLKSLTNKIKNLVGDLCEKFKDFSFFGKNKKVKKTIPLVKDIEDCEKEIIQAFEEKCKGNSINEFTNFYEISKSFSINDFNELINQIQVQNAIQEHSQLFKNYQEYYDIFDASFDNILALSVFEYQLVKIYTIDRDDYEKFKIRKNKCIDMREKLLFHGTKTEYIVSILKTFIDIGKNTATKAGKGFYLSDLLDVSWLYNNRKNKKEKDNKKKKEIPEIGDSFSVLVVNTYYSHSKIEYCYKKPPIGKEKVPKNGIRIVKARPEGKILSKEELGNYEKFIQNEYLISDESQMIPIYAITLRRIEYLIIWRDLNFDKSNPNNYKNFDKMIKFNEEIQKFAYKRINSKIYYVKTTEEGLKLIDRKKYNKIIIITNAGNNGEEFINKSRKILGANSIVLVSCYMPKRHLSWIRKLPNTFIGNEMDFIKEFLEYSILEKKDKMIELKNRNEKKYKIRFDHFNENELFSFPHFMRKGSFLDLTFNPEYNK